MKIPKLIEDLLRAQESLDTQAYVKCFAEAGMVFDEETTHTGHKAISLWFEDIINKYNPVLKPVNFRVEGDLNFLTTDVEGSFEGSPLLFTYSFVFNEEGITLLKIQLV
jgi:ketosteroid isomerase-like protein